MKSLDELKKIKEEAQKNIQARKTENKPEIVIGMGTCGIAAGARDILKTIMAELDKRDLDVIVSQTGCIGICEQEPLVDVRLPEGEKITYGNLETSDVARIITEHVVNGNVVNDLVIAKKED